jgi:predicted GNAT family acetyltransferase
LVYNNFNQLLLSKFDGKLKKHLNELIMEDVQLKLDEKKHGHFYITEDDERIAEMQVGISGNDMTVYHTEVLPKAEGKGLAKKIFSAMVDYARKNSLKVIALCPYVFAQFKRRPEEYADIWKNKD